MIGNQFQLVIYGEGLSVCMLSRCLFVIIEILSYPWTRSLKHFSYYRLQSRWDNSPGLITSFIWVMSSWIWLISYQYVSLPSIVSSFYSLDTEECPTEMKKSHHSLAFYKNKFPKTKSYIVFFKKNNDSFHMLILQEYSLMYVLPNDTNCISPLISLNFFYNLFSM